MANKFGMTSFIDDLVNLQISNSFTPLMKSNDENSFTFQHLPRQSDRLKINKHAYLNNQSIAFFEPKHAKIISQQLFKEPNQNQVSKMDFFEDIDDFYSRKQQISKIQKKYLSVLSNNSQHKRTKKKIFASKQKDQKINSSIPSTTSIDPNTKETQNWLQSKRELHSAMVQCYAHTSDQDTILNRFDNIMKRK